MTTATADTQLDELCVNTIRTLSMDGVRRRTPGTRARRWLWRPITYVLYTRVMQHNPGDPDWSDRDRFVLSAGHASMLLYSMLYLTGYGLDARRPEELPPARQPHRGPSRARRRRPASRPPPARSARASPPPWASRSAERMLAARFNTGDHEVVDHYTYTIASDGDIQEGVSARGIARLRATSAWAA